MSIGFKLFFYFLVSGGEMLLFMMFHRPQKKLPPKREPLYEVTLIYLPVGMYGLTAAASDETGIVCNQM